MVLFEKSRLNIGNFVLSKRYKKVSRKVSYYTINQVRKIGIVWDATKPEDFMVLSGLHQKMNERNIEVTILGYYHGKELPDRYTAIRYLSLLRKRDISFFFIPLGEEAEKFIKTDFDVIIDINPLKLFPLFYIYKLSRAKLKVGIYDKETGEDNYDLMIELKKPYTIETYLTQTIHYLEMINSGVTEKQTTIIT